MRPQIHDLTRDSPFLYRRKASFGAPRLTRILTQERDYIHPFQRLLCSFARLSLVLISA
jgi:hypothetical protein